MFFLRANTLHGPIILHCRGFHNKGGFGFVRDEGIFIVRETVNHEMPNSNHLYVVSQVVHVQINENGPTFHYTEDFKPLINYQEDTGYSTLDGGCWEVHNIHYLDSENNIGYKMKGPSIGLCMYTSAKNPYTSLGHPAAFFSAFMKEAKHHETTIVSKPFRMITGLQNYRLP